MERQTSKAARRTPSRDQRIEQPSVEDAPTVDKLSWKKHSRTTPSVADHYCLENASIDALPAVSESNSSSREFQLIKSMIGYGRA